MRFRPLSPLLGGNAPEEGEEKGYGKQPRIQGEGEREIEDSKNYKWQDRHGIGIGDHLAIPSDTAIDALSIMVYGDVLDRHASAAGQHDHRKSSPNESSHHKECT